MRVRKAVIPAAGLGTRMLSASKAVPKEMLPVVDRPVIEYLVEEIVQSGITEILIITSRGKSAVEDHFDYSPELEQKLRQSGKTDLCEGMRAIAEMAQITFIRQKEPKGLGHAVLCAREFAGQEPFALLLGDDLIHAPGKTATAQLCEAYEHCGASILGVQQVDPAVISRYGCIKPGARSGNLMSVLDMIEKPAPERAFSNYAALGRYVLTPEVFPLLAQTVPGVGGEIQLTDALERLCSGGRLFACAFTGKRYDTGDRLGYLSATVEYALADPRLGEPFGAYLKELAKGL